MDFGESLLLFGLLGFYFLPAIWAACRQHHNTGAIFALNLLLGWTLFFWIAALVWALTAVKPEAAPPGEPYREL